MDQHVHLKIAIKCLSVLGCWPLAFENKILANLYSFYYKLTVTIYVVQVFTELIELYLVINKTLDEFSFLMGVILLHLLGLIKLWIIVGPDVKRLIEKVKITEQNILKGDNQMVRDVFMEYVRRNHFVNIFLIVISIVTDATFISSPILTQVVNPPTSLYDIIDNSTVVYRPRPFPIASWFPFDRYKYYKTAFGWHLIVVTIIPSYVVACDNLLFGLIIFATGQIKILQKVVLTLEEGKTDGEFLLEGENAAGNLRQCIIYHKKIIGFVEELSNAMRTFLMVDFAACGLQVAVIGFQAAVGEISFQLLTTVVYLLTMLTQLFLFYWFGNEIIVESTEIANTIWKSKWYLYDESTKRTFVTMMMRAQKPLTLSIGPFYTVSTQTMMVIVRTGYSYAAIMRRLYSKD